MGLHEDLQPLTNERLAALRAMTDSDLLNAAADIIIKEPFLLEGSFRDVFDQARLARLDLSVNVDQPVACHCLEGAMREAAGIYYILDPKEPWFAGALYSVEVEFDRRRQEIDHHVVAQFDRAALAKVLYEHPSSDTPTLAQIDAGDYYAPGVVYLYSDNVLAALGKDGPKEAERILRAAAASIAAKESS